MHRSRSIAEPTCGSLHFRPTAPDDDLTVTPRLAHVTAYLENTVQASWVMHAVRRMRIFTDPCPIHVTLDSHIVSNVPDTHTFG
ncbi:unnamed protein product, partial [Brenthis ino]